MNHRIARLLRTLAVALALLLLNGYAVVNGLWGQTWEVGMAPPGVAAWGGTDPLQPLCLYS